MNTLLGVLGERIIDFIVLSITLVAQATGISPNQSYLQIVTMIDLNSASGDILQLHSLRDLMNCIRNGLVQEITKIDKDMLTKIANKVDPDVKQTPLLAACLYASEDIGLEMVKLIVERGAKPSLKDNNQQTVMYYLARDGKTLIAEYLLTHCAMDLNETDFCVQTPIFYASRDNRIGMVQLLIKHGASINFKDKNGQTCLFYAAKHGHYELCKYLIKMGVEVSHLDYNKKSAMYFAKTEGHQGIVDLLVSMKHQEKKEKEMEKNKEKGGGQGNEKKKPKKETPKTDCILVFTDQAGNVHELDQMEIEEFRKHNEKIMELMRNPQLLDLEPTPSEKKFQKIATRILNNFLKMQGSFLFHTPVDWQGMGLLDYPTIIKRPMDFTTIRTKLQNNAYENHPHFSEDMTQVFDNCILYNGPEHEYGRIAINLKTQFQSAMMSQFLI